MSRRVAIAFLALLPACDSEYIPDLTGRYSLVSHTVNGVTGTPPRVSAVLELSQQTVSDIEARGAMRFQMRRQGDNGASSVGGGDGVYSQDAEGRLAIAVGGHPFEGGYTLRGDTLTTVLVSAVQVSEQALYHSPRGKLVWVPVDGS